MSPNPKPFVFDQKQFQSRLRDAMAEKGLNNRTLADRSGISAVSIGNYVNGNRKPGGPEEIASIAMVLDISIDYLYGLSDEKRPADVGGGRIDNYADVFRVLDKLSDAFCDEANITVSGNNEPKEVIFTIRDEKLVEYKRQFDQLMNINQRVPLHFGHVFMEFNEQLQKEPVPKKKSQECSS